MPIYRYMCTECNHKAEYLRKVSDAPETRCPACESQNYLKQMTAPSFKVGGVGAYDGGFK